MHRMHELPKWSVKPPLEDMAEESMQLAEIELTTLQETE